MDLEFQETGARRSLSMEDREWRDGGNMADSRLRRPTLLRFLAVSAIVIVSLSFWIAVISHLGNASAPLWVWAVAFFCAEVPVAVLYFAPSSWRARKRRFASVLLPI